MKRRLIGISLLIALTSVGSSGVPAVAQVADPCSDLERAHEFDFWIGEWEVFSDGKLAGTNSIRPILDGCVLQEMWSGAQGGAGSSLNFYNPRVDKWQQFWVWRNGTTLNLSGAFEEGRMVLQGDSVSQSGEAIRNRITWTPNADGTVRQLWEVSKDQGESWQSAFDGLYKKKSWAPTRSREGLGLDCWPRNQPAGSTASSLYQDPRATSK